MTSPAFISDAQLTHDPIATNEISDAIESAIKASAHGHIWTTPKSAIMPGDGRYIMTTMTVGQDPNLTVVKTVTVSPDNPARELPSINGAISVFDAQTGLLIATMEAGWITAARTAALSLVAARRLASPQAKTLGFIGAGTQARSHLEAFTRSFPIANVLASGRGAANLARLGEHSQAHGLRFSQASPEEVVRGSDIIVTSVPLDYEITPFLDPSWMRPHAFAAITDLAIPWHKSGFSDFGAIYIDDHAQEAEATKPLVDPQLVTGDLFDLVTQTPVIRPGARALIFRGLGLGDWAAAALVIKKYRKKISR